MVCICIIFLYIFSELLCNQYLWGLAFGCLWFPICSIYGQNTYFEGQRCLLQATEGVCAVLRIAFSTLTFYGLYPLKTALQEILAAFSGVKVDSMGRLALCLSCSDEELPPENTVESCFFFFFVAGFLESHQLVPIKF